MFANAARHEPRVTIRRSVRVSGLTTGAPALLSAPHVTGVRTTEGEELRADLVVDATGRLSRASQWLTTIGARPPAEDEADSGFVYYTRYFHGRHDASTETEIRPWYDAQVALDRVRCAEMHALRDGQQPPPVVEDLALRIRALLSTMAFDPDPYRAALEYVGTVTPIQEVLARPGVSDAIRVVRERVKNTSSPAMPGPNRQQLLEIIS